MYLQFVRSGSSDYRGYTFYALTESVSEIGFLDKQRLKNLKKQIESENKGNVLVLLISSGRIICSYFYTRT